MRGPMIAAVLAGPVLSLVVWLGLALYTAIESGRITESRGR